MIRLPQFSLVFTLAIGLICSVASAHIIHRSLADPGSKGAGTADTGQNTQQLHSEFVPLSLLSESFWKRFQQSLTFSEVDNARIEKQVQLMQSGITALESNLNRAKPYLFYIADQLERAEIPLDIALLPLIESAFDPFALSSKGAVGYWQFIPATARHYGISINKNIDQRQDVIASTSAAIRYLRHLYKTFDQDWFLALAAYNTGPKNIRAAMQKAVARGLEPSYWNLRLSKETSNYVPKLIAAIKIINDPETFGLTLPLIPDRKIIDTVTTEKRVSLHHVAEMTATSFEELSNLNPGLRNGMTPINGPHRIVVPADIAALLREKLDKMQRLLLVDRLTQLELVKRNISSPLIVDSDPQSDKILDHKDYVTSQNAQFKTYTVKPGDTLWGVSKKAGVDIATLRSWNNLADNESIGKGDHLKIAYIDTENAGLMNYRVNTSDSLSSIAEKFDLAVVDIRIWNSNVRDENHIQTGQILRIPTYPTAPGKYSP